MERHPDVHVEHRSFALAPDPSSISRMFGDPVAAREEIMRHWAAAAAHPGGEAIDVALMRSREFPYPYSMPSLLACKAAETQGGMAAHWDMFDRLQKAHAVEALNVADADVLASCAADIGLDIARWEADFQSAATRQAVMADLREAQRLGVNAVPTVVFAGRWMLSGAVSEPVLEQAVLDVMEGRDPSSHQPGFRALRGFGR